MRTAGGCHSGAIADPFSKDEHPTTAHDGPIDAACPDDAVFVALLAGGLEPAQLQRLHGHIDGCERCRLVMANIGRFVATPHGEEAATVASVAGNSHAAAPASDVIGRGSTIGHFEVIEEIGHGGMGTVFAAHDALLGRRVALKLVRFPSRDSEASDARQRLLREAQAMAAISHVNVVTVHEVGTFGSQLFLAMELVDGGTLEAWLAAAKRRWVEITRMFIAAGRGLAAAHDAGLVHRDFKPQNVLVTHGGRACVTDFGLVAAQASMGRSPNPVEFVGDDWSTTLTATGTVMGTPRYMAPEQVRGAATDARTDQFAFCVALFEALFHAHPFGKHPREWMTAILEGRPHEPANRDRVPNRIRDAVVRGLASEPSARFASMTALLDELEAALRWRSRVAFAAIGSAALGVAVLGGFVAGRPETPGLCERAPFADFGASWRDTGRREAVARATSTGALGEQTWPRLAARLDDYVDRGEQLRLEICRGAQAEPTDDRVLATRRLDCLAVRDEALDVVTELLAAGEFDASGALDVAYGLVPLDACRDVSATASVAAPPPPEVADAITAIRRRVAAASASAWAGQPEQAVTSLLGVLAEAEQLDYAPIVGEVHSAVGNAAQSTDSALALEHLRLAHAIALREGADLEAVATLVAIAGELAERGEDRETTQWLIDEADAWHARLGITPGPALYFVRATLARARGDLAGAIAWGIRAADIGDATDASPRARSAAHGNLGAMYAEQRDLETARQHSAIALEIAQQAYGRDHRRTLRCRANLAGLELRLGNWALAASMAEEILAAYETTGIADLPEAAVALTMLGFIHRTRGETDAALVHDRRALEIRTRVFGDAHPLVAESLEKVALDQLGGSDPAGVVEQMRRVVQMRERLHPAQHPAIGLARNELAKALGAAGDRRAAAVEATAAVDQLAATLSSDDVRLYAPWLYAGLAMVEVGEFDRARDYVGRAAALGASANLTAFDWAELEFARARAEAHDDHTAPAARALATQARARLQSDDRASVALAGAIDRWLNGAVAGELATIARGP